MAIGDLIQQIEETERLIGVYRNANEVIVGTEDQIYSRRGLISLEAPPPERRLRPKTSIVKKAMAATETA